MKLRIGWSTLKYVVICTGMISMWASCQEKQPQVSRLEQNLIWAGPNRPSLESVLNHYRKKPQDSVQLKAATRLIENLESGGHYVGEWIDQFDPFFKRIATAGSGVELNQMYDSIQQRIGKPAEAKLIFQNDLRHLTKDFLIAHIDLAFHSWVTAPWASSISFETFCDYILPYRIFNEKTDLWRTKLSDQYKFVWSDPHTKHTMEDICCALIESQKAWFRYTEIFSDYPGALSLEQILVGHHGDCGEMARLGAYTASAMGIPVAIDFVPQWGNHTQGHIWNALIINDSVSLPFLGAESRPGDYTDIREGEGKIAKAFRKVSDQNNSIFAGQAKSKSMEDIPITIKNARLKDVTALYVPAGPIDIKVAGPEDSPIYLAIFKQGLWEVIAGAWIQQGSARFEAMGPEVLYLPVFWRNGKTIPAHPPVMIKVFADQKSYNINTQNKTTVTLLRKYPVKKFRARNIMAESIIDNRVEGSNTADFKSPTLLFNVPEPKKSYKNTVVKNYTVRDITDYETLWEAQTLKTTEPYRYIRLLGMSNKTFRVGDLAFYSTDTTNPINGTPIGNVSHPEWAFDGTIGHSIIQEHRVDSIRWVGMDFGRPITISRINYLPANDKNTILPDRTYELFYWKDRWVSLGIKKATAFSLVYDQVPTEGVYWLNCKDCNSTEERPFTYEQGKQVWW